MQSVTQTQSLTASRPRRTVMLMAAGAAVLVEAHSDGGSTDVDVRADPASERRIDARSSGGEVIVRYAGG